MVLWRAMTDPSGKTLRRARMFFCGRGHCFQKRGLYAHEAFFKKFWKLMEPFLSNEVLRNWKKDSCPLSLFLFHAPFLLQTALFPQSLSKSRFLFIEGNGFLYIPSKQLVFSEYPVNSFSWFDPDTLKISRESSKVRFVNYRYLCIPFRYMMVPVDTGTARGWAVDSSLV